MKQEGFMAGLKAGQVAFSKAGRDRGGAFIVIRTEGEYAYIADGKLRRLDNPKKKKAKHLQPVNFIDNEIAEKLSIMKEKKDGYITDSDIRKALERYTEGGFTDGEGR